MTGEFIETLSRIERKIDRLRRDMRSIMTMEYNMTREMDDLKAAVARSGDVEQSAVTLIKGISQQLRDAADDPQAIADLARQLNAQASTLAGAITENTPAQAPGNTGASTGGIK